MYSVYFMLKINENKIIKINRALNFSRKHTIQGMRFVQPLCHFALPSRAKWRKKKGRKQNKMNTIVNELREWVHTQKANESTDVRELC